MSRALFRSSERSSGLILVLAIVAVGCGGGGTSGGGGTGGSGGGTGASRKRFQYIGKPLHADSSSQHSGNDSGFRVTDEWIQWQCCFNRVQVAKRCRA